MEGGFSFWTWLPPTVDSKPDSFRPRAPVRLGAGSTYFLCAMFFFAVLNASSTLSQLEYTVLNAHCILSTVHHHMTLHRIPVKQESWLSPLYT